MGGVLIPKITGADRRGGLEGSVSQILLKTFRGAIGGKPKLSDLSVADNGGEIGEGVGYIQSGVLGKESLSIKLLDSTP